MLEKDKFSSDQFVISIDTVNLHKVNWFTATLRYFETLEEFFKVFFESARLFLDTVVYYMYRSQHTPYVAIWSVTECTYMLYK